MKDELFREEYSKKMSNALKLYYLHNDNSFKGKKHTRESKQKIGRANSKHQSGKRNNMYGRCWIFSEELKMSKILPKTDKFEATPKGEVP